METRLDKIIGSLYFAITEITYVSKLCNYIFNRNDIANIDAYLSTDVFRSYNKDEEKYVKNAVRSANRLVTTFRALIVICIFMYSLYPFIDKRLLPLDAWFPIDMEKYRYPLIVFQVFSVALSSLINSSIDIITIGFISVTLAHYSIIKERLINIKQGLQPQDVMKTIQQCCYYHNSVIR